MRQRAIQSNRYGPNGHFMAISYRKEIEELTDTLQPCTRTNELLPA